MAERILLKGGQALLPEGLAKADVLIEDGCIAAIGKQLEIADCKVMDCTGKVISPGFVDLHVHLREPGFSYKETIASGTKAAAAGGFTTVCTMPNLNPVPDSVANIQQQLDLIHRDALVNVLPFAAITMGEKGQQLVDIEALNPLCVGFSDDGKGVQREGMMQDAMARIAALDGLVSAHCEDESLIAPGGCIHDGQRAKQLGVPGISSASEYAQVERDVKLALKTGVRYHVCHISTKESIQWVRWGKAQGAKVSCEVTPHQIMLCEQDIAQDHGRFKMNPPLRTQEDRTAIIEGLLDGTIDCIATDHAPHSAQEKAKGLAASSFGIVGLETAFAVCHTALVKTGLMSLQQLLHKLTAAPAALIGREAALRPGAVADITVLDANRTFTVDPQAFYSMGKSSPFEGKVLTGAVTATFVAGQQRI